MKANPQKLSPLTIAREDYLADIYRIQASGQDVNTGDIAQSLQVSAASTSAMIRHLAEDGLVRHEPYSGVRLTKEGERAAFEVVRRHRIIERFLTDVLDIDWEQVDECAQSMEHGTPDVVLDAMERLSGWPLTCPHGYPIRGDDDTKLTDGELLEALPAGTRAIVVRVDESDRDLLRYLRERNLTLGAEVTIKSRNNIDGTRELLTSHGTFVAGQRISRAVTVRRFDTDG